MNGMLWAIAGTAIVLVTGEYLWYKQILKGEYARKFVHICTATFAAFWPLMMNRVQIVLLSVLFMVVLVVVKKLNLFKSLRGVHRTTYGEIWYAVGIALCALLFTENAIYAIAVLHMALADGFAAIVGVGMGSKAKKFTYNGSKKSIEGTLTFLAISFFLNAGYWLYLSGQHLSINGISPLIIPLYSIVCAFTLAVAEIVSPKGSDNVIIPLLAGFLLWAPIALFGSASILL
jgi:phytol kinase